MWLVLWRPLVLLPAFILSGCLPRDGVGTFGGVELTSLHSPWKGVVCDVFHPVKLACATYIYLFACPDTCQTLEEQITRYFHDIGDPPEETLGEKGKAMPSSFSCPWRQAERRRTTFRKGIYKRRTRTTLFPYVEILRSSRNMFDEGGLCALAYRVRHELKLLFVTTVRLGCFLCCIGSVA